MSEAVPEEAVVLRVGYDVEGVALFLNALSILPEEIQRISDQIAATPLGNTALFAARGQEVARAFVGGMQAELAGFRVGDMAALIQTRLRPDAGTPRDVPGAQSHYRELIANARTLAELQDRLRASGEPLAVDRRFSQATVLGLDAAGVSAQRVTSEFARLNEQIMQAARAMTVLRGLEVPKSGLLRGAGGEFTLRPSVERQINQGAARAGIPPEAVRALMVPLRETVHEARRATIEDPYARYRNEPSLRAANFQAAIDLDTARTSDAVQRRLTERLRAAEAAPPVRTPPALPPGRGLGPVDYTAEARLERVFERVEAAINRAASRSGATGTGIAFDASGQPIYQPQFALPTTSVAPPFREPSIAAQTRILERQNEAILERKFAAIGRGRDFTGRGVEGNLFGSAADIGTLQNLGRNYTALLRGSGLPGNVVRGLPEELVSQLFGGRPQEYSGLSRVRPEGLQNITEFRRAHFEDYDTSMRERFGDRYREPIALQSREGIRAEQLQAALARDNQLTTAEQAARTRALAEVRDEVAVRRQRTEALRAALVRDNQLTAAESAARTQALTEVRAEVAQRARDRAQTQRTAAALSAPPVPRGQAETGPAALIAKLRAQGVGDADLRDALVNLGYPAAQARQLITPATAAPTSVPTGAVYDPQDALRTLESARAAGKRSPLALHNAIRDLVPDDEERRALIRGEIPEGVEDRQRLAAERAAQARADREAAEAAARLRQRVEDLAASFQRMAAVIPARQSALLGLAARAEFAQAQMLAPVPALTRGQGPIALGGIPTFAPEPLRAITAGSYGRQLVPTPETIENLRRDADRARRIAEGRARLAAEAPSQALVRITQPSTGFTGTFPGPASTTRPLYFTEPAIGPGGAGGAGGGGTIPPPPPFSRRPGGRPDDERSSFTEDFKRGFRGRADRGFGEQVGQTARFSVLYGAAYSVLFNVAQAFQFAAREALAFQEAMVGLNVVTGQSTAQNAEFAQSLGEIAARSGASASEGLAAGAQAIGLYGLANAPFEEQRAAAETATNVAAVVSRITGVPFEQVNTQIAGTARSFGLEAADTPQLLDIVTYLSRQTGRPVPELLPAISNVGTLASSAGFSLAETGAIIGQVTSTTGQSALTAAGGLRQVLSRADDPRFQARVSELFGFNATGLDLATIFERVRATEPNQEEINRFSLEFGRGSSQQIAQILTGSGGTIQTLAEGAQAAAGTGLGAEEAQKLLDTFIGRLRVLGTTGAELGKDLIDTGLLDFLSLLVDAAQVTVDVLDDVVGLFNQLPRELRSVIVGLTELYLVLGLIGRTSIGTAVASRVAGTFGTVPRAAGAAGGLGRFFTGTPSLTRTGSAAAGALGLATVAGTGIRGAAAGLGGLVGLGALGGGLIAGGAVAGLGAVRGVRDFREARDAERAARISLRGASTADEFRTAASQAREAEKQFEAQQRFDIGTLGVRTLINNVGRGRFGLLGVSGESAAEAGDRRAAATAETATASAEYLEEVAKRAAAANPAAVFDFSSVDAVKTSLQGLADRGFSAAERIDVLNEAFGTLVLNAGRSADAVAFIAQGQGEDFASRVAPIGSEGLADVEAELRRQAEDFQPSFSERANNVIGTGLELFKRLVSSEPTQQELGKESARAADIIADLPAESLEATTQDVLDMLAGRGKDAEAGPVSLTEEDKDAIRETIDASTREDLAPILESDEFSRQTKDFILQQYNLTVSRNLKNVLGGFGAEPLTPDAVAANLVNAAEQALAGVEEDTLRTGDPLAAQRQRRRVLEDALAQADAAISGPAFDELSDDEQKDLRRVRRQFELDLLRQAEDERPLALARAQALRAVTASQLTPDDIVGRGALEIQDLRDARAAEQDPTEQAKLDAAINERITQQQRDARAARNATQLAGIDPRNVRTRLQLQIDNAVDDLNNRLTEGSAEYAALTEQVAQWRIQMGETTLRNLDLAQRAGIAPGDTAGLAQAAADDAARRLNAARRDAAADPGLQYLVDEATITAGQANYQAAQAGDAEAAALRAAQIDPRDTFRRNQDRLRTLRQQRATASRFGNDTQAAELDTQISQLLIDDANARFQVAMDNRRAARAGIESPLSQARAAVADATSVFRRQFRGTPEYAAAYADLQESKAELAKLEAATARTIRINARTDFTNPVQQARAEYADATARLREAQARGEGGDVLEGLRESQRQARVSGQGAEFSQYLNDLQFQQEIGQITQAEYVRSLQARRNLIATELAGMDETQDGYRQLVEQMQTVDRAIKGAANAMDAQFNLGDIKLPTPYEVRRSLNVDGYLGAMEDSVIEVQKAQTAAQRRYSVGPTAAGAQIAALTTLIGALTATQQPVVNNVQVDGADTGAVKGVLNDLLGPTALARSGNSFRRI